MSPVLEDLLVEGVGAVTFPDGMTEQQAARLCAEAEQGDN